ncbi:interferon-induced very large GTPase 1-like isoform 2-T2 [Aulostomus maculatus]
MEQKNYEAREESEDTILPVTPEEVSCTVVEELEETADENMDEPMDWDSHDSSMTEESEIKLTTAPNKEVEEFEENTAENVDDPMNEGSDDSSRTEESEPTFQEPTVSRSADEVNSAHRESSNDDHESMSKSMSPTPQTGATESKRLTPELRLVLVGDRNAIQTGSRNFLVDHDNQRNDEEFSSKLYDLCGRHISVIDMLGLQNPNEFPFNCGIHAFLLLVPSGLLENHYSEGVQWLEKVFGKESLAYLMTVVTYKSDEEREGVVTELEAVSALAENRYHKCKHSMMDENEVTDLLRKIDVMVSENDPHCYTCEEGKREGPPDHKSLEEEMSAPPVSQQHQTVGNECLSDLKGECDPMNEPSEKNEERMFAEESDIGSATNKKGIPDTDMDGIEEKQPMKQSEEIKRKEQSQREIDLLFSRLHLEHNTQQKMTPADILQICEPLKQKSDESEKDLAHTFLQRLMMLDYRARYIPVRQESPEVSHSKALLESRDTEDCDFDALFRSSEDSGQTKESHGHPMDVQMAVFHCSDSFLKQNMITKLSQCQYALPLIVPDPVTKDIECPLWTFRQITKSWKITQIQDDAETVTMKSMPIYKAKTPMVSFLRLGSLSLSKSQLMNSLINDRHMTFFHRNCPGSTRSRHLVDGLAEIAWYCPAGKPNDAFTDCIAFCNLHGDALTIEKQRNILFEKSSVNVVLLPTLDKDGESWAVVSALLKSPKPLICLLVDNDCGSTRIREGKYKMGLKDKSQSDTSEQLKGIIRTIFSGPHELFQLETMAKVSGIKVDENDVVCERGKAAAMKMVDLLKNMDISKIKDDYLPCQGKLWYEWCQLNKDQYNLKGHIERERCKKQEEMEKKRQEQYSASCSKVMQLFIESLAALPPIEKKYFLKWTQILFDALSTGDLSSILQKYDEKWSEVLTLKKQHQKSDQLIRKQTELEQISAKLQSATFGLEHIFREMAQIYEAHKSLNKPPRSTQTDWSKYPELAAELLISGHPMELMDGDAGHVPLIWITSLLDEVIKKIGNQNIFVLSVMGIQSSGKSTMLNAMFGLQFAVSAGRCTKGAFMQLVKVSGKLRKTFKFDYVLVVDTEGLRALELAGNATLHHDNELATFVVGLGNMTLLNIFGENPAEMQDVLQIVVQAFMRMKKVKLSPSCVFVHQNVTDIAAAEKNMDGKRRLQEKLDQMAKLAAKEEVCDAECFSDIIAFDVQKDVKYFAQLWEGSPPMAPPNPGYSESIQELKNIILSKASQSNGITLSKFQSKIKDLWNALLKENFVFSFKNTLEITVYRRLEEQYGNWTWALRSNMLTIENQLYTRIENGQLDTVAVTYLHKEMSKTYEKIKSNMTAYFNDERDKEMLVQWRGRFESKIKEFHDEQVHKVKRKLDEVVQQKKACKKLDDDKVEFEKILLQRSKELAQQLKDKAQDEEELKKQFNHVWSKWVTELTGDTKPINSINLEEDQFKILQDHGIEWNLIEDSRNSGSCRKISVIGDYFEYVSLTKHQDCEYGDPNEKGKKKNTTGQGRSFWSRWKSFQKFFSFGSIQEKEALKARKEFPFEEQNLVRSLVDNVEEQTIDLINSKPVATRGYSPIYLQEVAKTVKERVAEFESGRSYALKKEFEVDLLLYVLDIAGAQLLKSHEKFKMSNDAVTFVESKKTQNYNIFRSFCKGNSSAVVLGEMISEKLKASAIQAVCNKTAIDMAGEMKCNFPAFSGNRLTMEKYMLKSLAEKENFEGFMTYIRHPRKQAESFITEEVNKYIFEGRNDEAKKILKKNVGDVFRLLEQALFTATDHVKTKGGNTHVWLKTFYALLKDDLTFDIISSQNFLDIKNFDFLTEEINKGLQSVKEEMSNLSVDKIKEARQKPDQILIEQLCKCCWVQCPFCAAICTNTLANHLPDDHSVPFHRPSGIKGWHFRNTDELCINFCTTDVASEGSFYPHHDSEESIPFKLYRNGGPEYANWRITADESKLIYWKWFVCRFKSELESHFNLQFQGRGEIPIMWNKHTKKEAIKSLDEMCE